MAEASPTIFIQASCDGTGAIGIFQIYGGEDALAAALDLRLGGKKKLLQRNRLRLNELSYGWLRDEAGLILDEAMLAKPEDGMRVLTSHGGPLICRNIGNYLEKQGFKPFKPDSEWFAARPGEVDAPLDPLLAACLTRDQAAAVLEFRAGQAPFPAQLLTPRRLVLAGPPNVGKSSLLNRLAGQERAFVHEEAGATRDVVDEMVDLGGFAALVEDLPGFAAAAVGLDREAGKRAGERLRLAEAVVFVCDASRPWGAEAEYAAALTAGLTTGRAPVLVALNKSDLPARLEGEPWKRHFPGADQVRLCSLPGGDAAERMGPAAFRLWGGGAAAAPGG
jgi:small GTP-binding protein